MANDHRFDASNRTCSADAALMTLYARLAERNAPAPDSYSTLQGDERRAYFRDAKRRSRERQQKAADNGRLEPTLGNVRTALADAALMLLATDSPGAQQVRVVLASVFAARPGVPLSIEQRARTGKIRPKLVRAGQ